jgi:transcriptional regulator with XRE-family HTH domain
MDSHERKHFAAELRRLRAHVGLSLGELAGEAHVNRGYVSHIEHGQRWPSRSVAAALDDALDARGTLLAAWTAGDRATPPVMVEPGSENEETLTLPLDEWTTTDSEALAERLATGSDRTLTATIARRLVHEWLTAETPQTVEITAGRRIGRGMVDTVTRRVAQLRRVDDFIAGRELRPLVERELRLTAGLLREAAYTDQVGRALLSAIAELCQLAGWVTVDAGAPEGSLYLIAGQHQAAQAAPLLTALVEHWLTTAQDMALDFPHRRHDPPVTTVLDELTTATPVPQLPDIISDSAGRGVLIHWAAQSLAKLEDVYSSPRGRQLLDNTTTLSVWGGLKVARLPDSG